MVSGVALALVIITSSLNAPVVAVSAPTVTAIPEAEMVELPVFSKL